MNLNLLQTGDGKAYWAVGDLDTALASGEDTGGAYALLPAMVPPGGGPPPPHIYRRQDGASKVRPSKSSC